MTTAEYLAKLKSHTRAPKKSVINLIYGLDGMVVGNSDELLGVAEMLLHERDTWMKKYHDLRDGETKKRVFGPDIGGDGEVWGDHPSVLADQLKGKS